MSWPPLAGVERIDPVLTAVVLECYDKPPAPAGASGRDAFGHVPDVDLPAERRLLRAARTSAAATASRAA